MLPLRYEIAAKAIALDTNGMPLYSVTNLANTYNCSKSTVIKYRDEYAETGQIEDKRRFNSGAPRLTDREERELQKIFRKNPSTSLRSASHQLDQDYDIKASPA